MAFGLGIPTYYLIPDGRMDTFCLSFCKAFFVAVAVVVVWVGSGMPLLGWLAGWLGVAVVFLV